MNLNLELIFLFSLLKIHDGVAGDSMRERTKTFTYDFSYDSTDSKSSGYVSQEKVTCAFQKLCS